MKRLLFSKTNVALTFFCLVACAPKAQVADSPQSPSPSPTPQIIVSEPGTAPTLPPQPAPGSPTKLVLPSGSLITQSNLDRVEKDMSPGQVVAILGQPTSSQSAPIPIVGGTQTTYHYDDGASSIAIVFKNDEMKTKTGHFLNQ